jgi:2-polyprenyl-3-methyl-5-hydroxy-6-metoxy-1,4-benzoquinol methylase
MSRLQREKLWHERYFSTHEKRARVISHLVVDRYLHPKREALYALERMMEIVGDIRGKRVLCYGCGENSMTVILALKGARVSAIDISEAAMAYQCELARQNQVQIQGVVGAIESMPFPNRSFDVVFGNEILHHVTDSLEVVSGELLRVLEPNGIAVFSEPILRSKWFGRIRGLFPKFQEMTADERQMNDDDFAKFHEFICEFDYFAFLARLGPFIVWGKPLEIVGPIRSVIVKGLARSDRVLFRSSFFQRFASRSVITMRPIVGH